METLFEVRNNESEDTPWYVKEFETTVIGDERLHSRLMQMLAALWENPTGSLPEAFPNWSQLKAAYRFYDNDAVSAEELLGGFIFSSTTRCKQVPVVLAISDTSFLDYTEHKAKTELGHLNGEHRGLLMHSAFPVTPEGIPLGLLGQQLWTRDVKITGTKHQRQTRAYEEKESFKWAVGLEQVQEAAVCCPNTEFDYVCDAEGDIYELFEMERVENVQLLVRAAQNRRVKSEELLMRETLQSRASAVGMKVRLPRRGERKAREAKLELHFGQVIWKVPRSKKGKSKDELCVWGVLVTEISPPEGEEAVDWVLVSSREIKSPQEAVEAITKYGRRWDIEIFHRVLKSGCMVEKLQLETVERLERALSLYVAVAWRIMYATMLGRELPNIPCTGFLERSEWEALYCVTHKTNQPCESPPTVGEAVLWIAQIGGYLARKHDRPPGPTVVWRGFQKLAHYTEMYCFMNRGSP